MNTDAIPPHSIEVELGVIGCLLDDAEVAVAAITSAGVGPNHFYDLRHRRVFAEALAMREARQAVSFITIRERLNNLRSAGEEDWKSLLVAATAATLSAHECATLCYQLVDLHHRRSALEVGRRIAELALSNNCDDVLADVHNALDSLSKTITGSALLDKLEGRAYSQQALLVEPLPRYFLAGVGICTAGNITTISAQAKHGKTAAIGAMLASALAERDGDFLGFKSSNPNHHAIVTIDTEQSQYDHWKLIERARIRAGLETMPEWLQSFCLTGFPLPEIRASLRLTLAESAKRFGGIHSFILDGAADAVPDVNDPLEANALVAEIHALAIEFDCPVVTIIHLNPSSDSKTRGHLGSQLERKAETNLRLKRDAEEITTMWCDKNRRAPIPEKTAPRFVWCNEAGMHVSVTTQSQTKSDTKTEDADMKVREAFRMSDKPQLNYADLIRAIQAVPGVNSISTAERLFRTARNAERIRRTPIGQWELSP